MPLGDEVPQLEPVALAQAVVDDDELDLHLFGQDVLDVNTDGLSGVQVRAALGQTGEVGRNFDEGAVLFDAPDDADNCFANREGSGVLLPCSQKLPDGEDEPSLYIPALDGTQNLLADADPVGRRGNAADRHAVDREQCADAAAHVTERAERFDVGHRAGQDVAGHQPVEVVRFAHPLCLGTGKPIEGLTAGVGVQGLDDKAGRAAHPGQDGDIPDRTGLSSVGALGEGHDRLDATQLEPELTLGVKGEGSRLQNFTICHCGVQLGGGQTVRAAVISFGTKSLHHLSFLFLS